MKKPNQIQDELTGVIYPPSQAIMPQLAAIRSIASATIKVYENTEDIHSIFPNLDQMQRGIDYLRGAPAIEIPEEPEPPEDVLQPGIWVPEEASSNYERLKDGTYLYTIDAFDIPYKGITEEFFGQLPVKTLEISLVIQIQCNRRYTITQCNPILEYYKDDPSVYQDEDGSWVKMKNYMFTDDDILEYKFLIPTGRNVIEIYVDDEDGEVGKFRFITHVHFEKQEEEENPEEPGTEPEKPPEGEDNNENEDSGSNG